MQSRIHVITLAVEDLEPALGFYRDGLELESPGIIGTERGRVSSAAVIGFHAGVALVAWSLIRVSSMSYRAFHQRLRTPAILQTNAKFRMVFGVNEPGLRERKKQATRDALRLAAARLAALRGWDQVRVEDIAAEAGVSTRTFNNYFTSKEEAFLATAFERAARAEVALASRPADEPLWSALTNAVVDSFTTEEIDLRQARLVAPTPTLAGEQLKAFGVIERRLAHAIARRIGSRVEHDIYPRLVAGALMSAVRVAFEHWIETESDQPLPTVVRDTLGRVTDGLPVPPERSSR
jgi:AcrR family transcriptional regulator